MSITTLADLLTGPIEALMLFMVFEAFAERRENIKQYIYAISVIALGIAIDACNYFLNLTYINIIAMLVLGILFGMEYKIKIFSDIMISVFWIAVISLIEVAIFFIIVYAGHYSMEDAVNSPQLRLLGIVISKLTTLFLLEAVCAKAKKNKVHTGTEYWIFFFLILLFSVSITFIIFKFSFNNGVSEYSSLSLISCMLLLYVIFFMMYLYDRMGKQAEIISEQKLYKQQVEDQKKYYDEILTSQARIQAFKHDILNHMIAINSYFENKNYDEGIQYIKELENVLTFRGESIDTGNSAIDSIVSAKKITAESSGIKFSAEMHIPEKLSVEAIDECVILGNLLDNAIEACNKAKIPDKFIKLSVVYNNKLLIIETVNSSINSNNSKLSTTKDDKKNHGFGISNIREAIKKYNGILNFENGDGQFKISVMLFL